jgi:hypothetical protein
MKVSELIALLQKCDPDADVEFAWKSDTTTSGNSVNSVAQFVFFGDGTDDEKLTVVQLQG